MQCGKPIGNAPRGSMTSWIFGRKTCVCSKSLPDSAPLQNYNGQPAVAAVSELIQQTENYPEIGDRYDVLSIIGQGGMGTVYKVRDKKLSRDFAVKVLRAELARDDEAVKRFVQEAKAAANLAHPNLVAVYDVGVTPAGAPYLVQDYAEGRSLAQEIQAQAFLDVERGLEIFVQICHAIEHAHAKGVIHRDLKPSNIIVRESTTGQTAVKVVDFGIAKVLPTATGGAANLTQTGDIFGSPLYMSPEQCKGETITKSSDIYALGCVFYETLTGKAPFAADNPIKVILKQVQESPTSLSVFKSLKIPEDLNFVVMRCLEKEPSNRYESVTALREDLEHLQAGTFVQARSAVRGNRAGGAVSQAPSAKKLTVIGLCIGAIALVSAGLFELFGRSEKPRVVESPSHLNLNKSVFEIVSGDMDVATADDRALKYLIDGSPMIEQISMDNAKITDLGMKAFQSAKRLTRLNLAATKITDKGLQYLTELPLTMLDLGDTNVSDAGMRSLAKIQSLRNLQIGRTEVGDEGCAYLSKLVYLRKLDLNETRITAKAIQYLGKLEHLEDLSLNSDPLGVAGMNALARLHLRWLTMRRCLLNDSDMSILAKMPSLTGMDLESNAISDVGLLRLARMTNLRRLVVIGNVAVTEAGVQEFSKISPRCNVFLRRRSDKSAAQERSGANSIIHD
jgi:serine/threonine protein kinase